MRYYVALAHRWNQTNNHTYIVGVSTDLIALSSLAKREIQDRGGKYGVGIYNDENELVRAVVSPTGMKGDNESTLYESGRKMAAELIGTEVLQALKEGYTFVTLPGLNTAMKHVEAPLPDWLKAEAQRTLDAWGEDDPATLTPTTPEQLTTPEEIACLDEALAAFWAVVKSRLPGETTYDLRSRFAFQLEEEAARAILTWKNSNEPILE